MGAPVKHSWEGRITSRVTERGNEHESTWPPEFGTGDKTPFHIDAEGNFKKGRPKRKPKHGVSAAIVPDSIKPFYHHGACRMVDTRSALNRCDRDTGCVTVEKRIEADTSTHTRRKKELAEDLHVAMKKSVAQVDSGTAPLNEEQRALCERQNEIVAAALPGFDPFNAAGRRKNKKGKRYSKT